MMTVVEAPTTRDPPVKGDWRGLHDHFTRPVTPEYRGLLATGMEAGEAESFALYGIPVRAIACRFVNGRVFIGAAPLVGPETSSPPPAPLLWLACRIVPAFRRRARAARRALAERRWLGEAAHWYEVERAVWQDRCAALEAVEPAGLDDDDLAAHLRAVQHAADDGYRTHFRVHGPDLLPLGIRRPHDPRWGGTAHGAGVPEGEPSTGVASAVSFGPRHSEGRCPARAVR